MALSFVDELLDPATLLLRSLCAPRHPSDCTIVIYKPCFLLRRSPRILHHTSTKFANMSATAETLDLTNEGQDNDGGFDMHEVIDFDGGAASENDEVVVQQGLPVPQPKDTVPKLKDIVESKDVECDGVPKIFLDDTDGEVQEGAKKQTAQCTTRGRGRGRAPNGAASTRPTPGSPIKKDDIKEGVPIVTTPASTHPSPINPQPSATDPDSLPPRDPTTPPPPDTPDNITPPMSPPVPDEDFAAPPSICGKSKGRGRGRGGSAPRGGRGGGHSTPSSSGGSAKSESPSSTPPTSPPPTPSPATSSGESTQSSGPITQPGTPESNPPPTTPQSDEDKVLGEKTPPTSPTPSAPKKGGKRKLDSPVGENGEPVKKKRVYKPRPKKVPAPKKDVVATAETTADKDAKKDGAEGDSLPPTPPPSSQPTPPTTPTETGRKTKGKRKVSPPSLPFSPCRMTDNSLSVG